MILLIALLAILIWAAVATIVEVRRDGYRRIPTDWSRVAEHGTLQRADVNHGYR